MSHWYKQGRTCSECGQVISDKSRTGLCRPHFNKRMANDPAVQRKKRETLLRRLAEQPERRATLRDAARRAAKKRWADPVYAENARRTMRELVQPQSVRLEYRHFKVAAAASTTEKKLAWCPTEYREAYRNLVRTHKMLAHEARRAIRDQIKADLAKLSPFERQERALRNGAQLAANDRGPMFGEALKVG